MYFPYLAYYERGEGGRGVEREDGEWRGRDRQIQKEGQLID